MPRVEWTEDLATGSPLVDQQHKELFNRVNKLLAACEHGEGRWELDPLLKFLEEYAVTHFGTEEGLMFAYEYPQLEEHKRLHREFMDALAELKTELKKNGATLQFVVKVNGFMMTWLRNHLRGADREMGMFLKGCLLETSPGHKA
jgi:hemerythrin